MQSVTKEVH